MVDYAALKTLLGRQIAFPPAFAKIGGSVNAGVMLAQLGYWTDRASDPDGWIYKTQVEWEEETTLTRREQETARRDLRAKGVLEEKRAYLPARLYYRVNVERLYDLLAELSDKPACENAPDLKAESAKLNGENSQSYEHRLLQEITSENIYSSLPKAPDKEPLTLVEPTQKRKAKRATQIPKDFSLSPAMAAYATRQGISNPQGEFEKFTLHHQASGKVWMNWTKAWEYWCRRQRDFTPRTPQNPWHPPVSHIPTLEELEEQQRDGARRAAMLRQQDAAKARKEAQ